MRQKISYFNKNLYRHTLVRFWPIWAAYFCVWLFPLLGVPDSLHHMNELSDITRFLQYSLPSSLYQIGILTSFIFAAFAAMAVFSHLYTIRSAGAFGALPLRRECVFLTQTAAGLTAFWAVNILGLCLYCVVIGAYGHLSLFLPSAMHLFAQFCLLNLLFFGFAVLCAQLTGHVLVLPVVYVVLLFTVIVVETIVRQLLSDILFGFLSSGSRLDFLSPVVKLLSTTGWRPVYADEYRTFLNVEFTGWEYLAGYAAAGLVFLLLGLCLSRRRRMESAGDVVAVRPLRPVFKYCLAAGCALVLCVLLLEILFYQSLGTDLLLRIILLLLLGAFIGYFTAQMLL
ncbi:MAG: hypothetical protein Q4A39_03890, partial [Eubacteriales bacterium]|nr:hypothetical protein [Eubacteriales bacterium]